MSSLRLECLQSYQEFQLIRSEWDHFMDHSFPENYARTHSWLSAFWATHMPGESALIYIQRASASGKIVAIAPLLIKKENFGGFWVRMLQALGRGIGSDDFLLGSEAEQTVQAVFADLKSRHGWDVTNFKRVTLARFQNELRDVSRGLNFLSDITPSKEHYVVLPKTYGDYLASRSSKFRNNLKNALKRLALEGPVTIEILPAYSQAERALLLCAEVAQKSWQFKAGKSHFNEIEKSSLYGHLTKACREKGGEEFVVLLAGNKPVAYLLGCLRGQTYHLVDTAYDESLRNISVGRVLFCKTIERLIEDGGINRFSLEGEGDYKDYYANESETAHEVTIYNCSLYGRSIKAVRNSRLYTFMQQFQKRYCQC